MHVTFNIIDLIIMKRFNLTDKVIEQFKVYFEDSCNINQVGNGITMVTSDMAGIALTFADSDPGLYITYMETLC